MTVGIAFTNGLEAIAITDSRSSGYNYRQSDSVNKMGDFHNDNYCGVVFGAGNGNLIAGVITNLDGFAADNLDDYVELVHRNYKARCDKDDISALAASKIEIEKKAKLIESEEERNQFIRGQVNEAIQNYNNEKRNTETTFILIGYDNKKGKIRLFYLDPLTSREASLNHLEIGSGYDGANLYLGTKLQGVDSSKLDLADLAFFVLNAYATSTVNQGVGGTPKIARISKDGCEIVPPEKSVVLANLSGAYLSESPALTHESTRRRFKEILDGDDPNYKQIAQEVGLGEDTLKTTYIPYSSWQERANRRLFNQAQQQKE